MAGPRATGVRPLVFHLSKIEVFQMLLCSHIAGVHVSAKKSSPRRHHHPPSLMWFAWLCRHTYFATSFVVSGPEWEKHHIKIRPRVLTRCGLRVSCARCEERQLSKEKLRQRRSRNEHKEKDQDLLTTLPVKSPALLAGLQVLRKTPRPGEGHEYRKTSQWFCS